MGIYTWNLEDSWRPPWTHAQMCTLLALFIPSPRQPEQGQQEPSGDGVEATTDEKKSFSYTDWC